MIDAAHVYDALFAWLRHAAEERHNWPSKVATDRRVRNG